MKPIRENDYYGIFQTGLLLALEVLGVKQAQLARVCEISEGYLSKLKGWNLDPESGKALARPHRTNTNFKRYSVPLLQFLEQEHQFLFQEGYFVSVPGNNAAGQWGDINTIQLPARPKQERLPSVAPSLLGNMSIPEKGELTIELTLDLSNEYHLRDMLNLLRFLNDLKNIQLKVKILVNNSQRQPNKPNVQSKSPSGLSPEDLLDFCNRGDFGPRYINLEIEQGGSGFSDLVSTQDANSGIRQEQFCDYSDWEALHREGHWDFMPKSSIIRGGGMNQYLLSRYTYGAYPYSLYAVIQFNGYAQHAGASTETANAGIILGWKQVEDRYQYYNLLLDGQTIRLEQVGARTGDHFNDYQHLDAGVPFVVEDGMEYQFLVYVTQERVAVFVDKVLRYQFVTPSGLEGRAGIRPWRAQVACSYFEIREER